MKILALVLVLSVALGPGTAFAAPISADDFLPPVKADSAVAKEKLAAVELPEKVQEITDKGTGQPATTAATMQDAINATLTKLDTGCEMVMFNERRGWVAAGVANYRTMTNPNATRLAKREAYVRAFMVAKTQLAAALNGMSNEAKSAVAMDVSDVQTATQNVSNVSNLSAETIQQVIRGAIRGYVVYSVNDDAEKNSVKVAIVTTPKTRGELSRPTPTAIQTADLRAGINHAFDEITNGLLPPVGGKIVSVPTTGEIAFIGFGSAIINQKDNAALQSSMKLVAEKLARARANDALFAIIRGEDVKSTTSIEAGVQDSISQFQAPEAEDPLAKDAGAPEIQAFEKDLETFRSDTKVSEVSESLRKGILPPGINVRTHSDDEGGWMYAIAVYLPSLTDAAGADAKAMRDSEIVKPLGIGTKEKDADKKSDEGFTDKNNTNIARPSDDVGKGPSGQVTPDSDL